MASFRPSQTYCGGTSTFIQLLVFMEDAKSCEFMIENKKINEVLKCQKRLHGLQWIHEAGQLIIIALSLRIWVRCGICWVDTVFIVLTSKFTKFSLLTLKLKPSSKNSLLTTLMTSKWWRITLNHFFKMKTRIHELTTCIYGMLIRRRGINAKLHFDDNLKIFKLTSLLYLD